MPSVATSGVEPPTITGEHNLNLVIGAKPGTTALGRTIDLGYASNVFAAVAAMGFPDINGYILGPAMGLGMIIPGMMAEKRVRRLQAELAAATPAATGAA